LHANSAGKHASTAADFCLRLHRLSHTFSTKLYLPKRLPSHVHVGTLPLNSTVRKDRGRLRHTQQQQAVALLSSRARESSGLLDRARVGPMTAERTSSSVVASKHLLRRETLRLVTPMTGRQCREGVWESSPCVLLRRRRGCTCKVQSNTGLFVSARPLAKQASKQAPTLSWQGLVGTTIGLLLRFQGLYQQSDGLGSYLHVSR